LEKSSKFILIAIIGTISFGSFFLYYFGLIPGLESPFSPNNSDIGDPLSSVENITLIIDYDNGTIKTKEDFTLDGGKTSVFDALDKWCEIKYMTYSGERYFITEIDGVSGSWIYKVNGELPPIAANYCYLEDEDEIEWIHVG